MEEKEKCQ